MTDDEAQRYNITTVPTPSGDWDASPRDIIEHLNALVRDMLDPEKCKRREQLAREERKYWREKLERTLGRKMGEP